MPTIHNEATKQRSLMSCSREEWGFHVNMKGVSGQSTQLSEYVSVCPFL